MNPRTVCPALVTCLVLGCAGTEPRAPANDETATEQPRVKPTASSEPFEHEGDTEYQNGLAEFMTMAPLLGRQLVTSVYQVGYLTGLQEARDFQAYMDGNVGGVGCLAGFRAVSGYFARPTEAGVAKIADVCANKNPDTNHQGPLFSKWRMKEAQWAGEHFQDPREIKALITIYVVGYNMGFAHRWESIDQDAHVEEVFDHRCELVAQNVRPPLSTEQIAAASTQCRGEARAERQKFGPQMKCLLVGDEGNSDLSGLRTKPGCNP
jgi:hypothetical protein